MSELHIYHSNSELPPHLDCQIRSFIRINWYDAYRYEGISAPVLPEEWHPSYVVATESHALISHAGVVWKLTEHQGHTYKTYGLSSVFTYPAFRKNGYGQQVVEAATRMIESDPEADNAILFTDPELEAFYARCGWETMPTTTVLKGDKHAPQVYDAFTMMRFLSARGKAARPAFDHAHFYFSEHPW